MFRADAIRLAELMVRMQSAFACYLVAAVVLMILPTPSFQTDSVIGDDDPQVSYLLLCASAYYHRNLARQLTCFIEQRGARSARL